VKKLLIKIKQLFKREKKNTYHCEDWNKAWDDFWLL
jgi:hypothetical protein